MIRIWDANDDNWRKNKDGLERGLGESNEVARRKRRARPSLN